jgi:hypothetical protein
MSLLSHDITNYEHENKNLVLIDSKHRYSGTSTNFRYRFNRSLIKVKSVELLSCQIPNTFYNIRSNYTFQLTRGPTFNIVVPAGSYTLTTLMTTIQTLLNAADGPNYTVTYDSITLRVTISNIVPFSLFFPSLSDGVGSAGAMLGYNENQIYTAINNIATNAPDMLIDFSHYLIQIAEIPIGLHAKNGDQYYSFCVPIEANANDFTFYNSNSHFRQNIHVNGHTIRELEIKLYASPNSNIPIDLNGVNWKILFSINYY